MHFMSLVDTNTHELHTIRSYDVTWAPGQNYASADSTDARENRMRRLNALRSSRKNLLKTQSQIKTMVSSWKLPRNNHTQKKKTEYWELPFISFAQIRANANHDISRTDAVDGNRIQAITNASSNKSSMLFRPISIRPMIIVYTLCHLLLDIYYEVDNFVLTPFDIFSYII